MTTAVFKVEGGKLEVDIAGHALFGAGGADIVCASCSTLACTLHQALLALNAEGALHDLSVARKERSGRFSASGEIDEGGRERVEEVLRTIIGGYALLEKKYPDNVKLRVTSGER